MPELAFVAPRADADGAAELAAALCAEVGRQDAAARLFPEPPPPREDRVYVVFPVGDGGEEPAPPPARTIAVLSAAPGTERFERQAELAGGAGAVFHLNSAATERLLELGVPARHLQLGYSAEWDRGGPDRAGEVELAVVRGGYFDWPRALAAIHAGAAVLHEEALGQAPLLGGRHLFTAAAADLDGEAAALRGDPEALDRVCREAREFTRAALPLALAAAALIGSARALVAQPLAAAS